MSTVIGNSGNALTLTIPTRADLNWDAVMQAAFLAITTHTHDGVSNGSTIAPIQTVVSQLVTKASPVTGFSTTTSKNVATITLPAGDWDISCLLNFENTTSSDTVTSAIGGIGTTTGTLPTDNGGNTGYGGATILNPGVQSIVIPSYQVNPVASTQYWLVGNFTFAAGAVSAWGNIRARSMR